MSPILILALVLVVSAASALIWFRFRRSRSSGLPGYWRKHLAEKLPEVLARDAETGSHGDSFIFITDLHYNDNDGHSAAAVKYILDRSAVRKIIVGGDICNGSSRGKQVGLGQVMNFRNAFMFPDLFYIRGNHDSNTEISGRRTDLAISDEELYDLFLRPVEDRIVRGEWLSYYFDNPEAKIRYICLDTGHPDPCVLSDTQVAWMQDTIRELLSGWTVIVLTHQYLDPGGAMDGNGQKILPALTAIYDEVNAVIACVICGHCHDDFMETTEKGFPVITTTCDVRVWQEGQLKRKKHTCTEQAFDVFHIDTAARKIHITRIGAGADRQASY